MNILSLFDGMSCGQIALNRAGIKIDKYYASEIDKYAITIAQKNYPNTIQLGNVQDINTDTLPKIDLLIGGSPCQGFSFAGRQLNFNDPRSRLFFEYVRILKEIKPTYFLLENVRMKQEYQDIISEQLGVQPIAINSNLVSAQNRYRLYWTNIPNITQPQDKGLVLKDIVDTSLPLDRSIKDIHSIYKTKTYWQYDNQGRGYNSHQNRVFGIEHKSNTLAAGTASVPKINYAPSHCRIALMSKKVGTMTTSDNSIPKVNYYSDIATPLTYRMATPVECERLQTVPDNYTEGVSNAQRYKMLGNGWTVDVIVHILQSIVSK